MTRPLACQNPCQNSSLIGKNKLAEVTPGPAFTDGNETPTATFAMLCFLIPASALAIAPAIAFTSAIINSIVKYLAKDL